MTGKAAYDYRTQDCLHTAIRTDRADEMVARYRGQTARNLPVTGRQLFHIVCLKYISTAERKIEIYCSMLIVFYMNIS